MRSLWIPLAFYLLGVYTFVQSRLLESVLYISVGSAFLLLDASKNQRFAKYKKELNILSWIFVAASILLFIAVLRQDAYNI